MRLQDDDEKIVDESVDSGDDIESSSPELALSQNTKIGKLPDVYTKCLLVRPYPSLRTIFVSESAKKLGNLQQKSLFAHIVVPSSTLSGLKEYFQFGTPNDKANHPSSHGEVCWISATPLFDGNDKVGVWMVFIVDKTSAALGLGRRMKRLRNIQETAPPSAQKMPKPEDSDIPIKLETVGIEGTQLAAQEDEDGLDSSRDEASSTLVTDPKTPDNTQRSASSTKDSLNGSHDPNSTAIPPETFLNGHGPPVLDVEVNPNAPSTLPPQEGSVNGSETTPRQNWISGGRTGPRDAVGLRAMDYLTSRSTVVKRNVNGVDQGWDNGNGKADWNVASPYSVD
ncbi:hypothetical protein BDZ45DRAFT_739691 [Acephala macrosclerotiorum]|nr:hypothetical protein BDZ45DRAFT_739691 [Acephala macrosclerotiorum]